MGELGGRQQPFDDILLGLVIAGHLEEHGQGVLPGVSVGLLQGAFQAFRRHRPQAQLPQCIPKDLDIIEVPVYAEDGRLSLLGTSNGLVQRDSAWFGHVMVYGPEGPCHVRGVSRLVT